MIYEFFYINRQIFIKFNRFYQLLKEMQNNVETFDILTFNLENLLIMQL